MSETCIVCLGDLGESVGDSEPLPTKDGLEDQDQIARLLPCGHILHDDCLKPWVERANSCPICRRNFNMVELSDRLGGTSYSLRIVLHLSLY